MGSSTSKPARSSANAVARRQYPKKPSLSPPKSSPATAAPEGTASLGGFPNKQPSPLRSEAIDLDARDPHFAASLRSIGPVIPKPTFSHSSTFRLSPQLPKSEHGVPSPSSSSVFSDSSANPALLALNSRARITKEAEQEAESFGRSNHTGRKYLDVLTIRQILNMRDQQNLNNLEIERLLRLKSGVVDQLGKKGIYGAVG